MVHKGNIILKTLIKPLLWSFNDISEGKSRSSIRGLWNITKRKLQWKSKSPSEAVDIAAPQVMI
jgi:hypothetical protein